MAETDDRAPARSTSRGFGRVLIAVYGLFALAATARSAVQLATKFHEAPLAYLLSAFAAVVYIVATVSLARGDAASRRVATVAISIELVGVVTVGAASLRITGSPARRGRSALSCQQDRSSMAAGRSAHWPLAMQESRS